jgi:glycosyltransferase involved in cell wall biosynthesis
MEKISIIIPAYNEEKRIGSTLEEYGKFFTNLKKNKKLDSEILIVINNTHDKTEEVIKKYQKKYKIIKFLNFKQGGKGFAITEGFKEALKNKKNSLIGFVDADASTSAEAYYDLIRNIGNLDGIIASRYIKGAIVKPKQSIRRIFVSRVFNLAIRALFLMPYRDTQCGAKIFTSKALDKFIRDLTVTQWAFDVDLLYKARREGRIVKEFPTKWSDKDYSTINFMKAGPRMVLALIRLRIANSPFRFLVRAYDMLPDWIKIHVIYLKKINTR